MAKQKVLYISYDGMTDALGQSQVLPYLIGLQKHGHEITVLSCEKEENFLTQRSKIDQICETNKLQWHPLKYRKSPIVISTLRDMLDLMRKAKELHSKNSFSIVHCRSYLPGIIGLQMKKKSAIKFIFDMRGFWADERIEGNIWDLKNPVFKTIYKFFKRQEKKLFNDSDSIVSLTYAGKNELLNGKYGDITESKISVIPCCVDDEKFNPSLFKENDRLEALNNLQIKSGSFVLGYVGSVGTWYLLPEMLRYFKIQLSEFPESVFAFLTAESPNLIFNEAKKQHIPLENLRVKRVSFSDVSKYMLAFNKALFFIKPSFSKTASSPIKQGELMAMGIPVICNKGVGDTSEIVTKYESGHLVEMLSDENYKKVNLNDGLFDANKIRQGAIDYFGLEKGIAAYAAIYDEL
jgi:glycosyltransferase involved in cell wall biosynthesis